MSADYDRLFHSPEAVLPPEEEKSSDDRASVAPSPVAAPAPMPIAPAPDRADAPSGPMPIAPPLTQVAPAPPPRQTEVTAQMRPATATGPVRMPNGMMRTPQ